MPGRQLIRLRPGGPVTGANTAGKYRSVKPVTQGLTHHSLPVLTGEIRTAPATASHHTAALCRPHRSTAPGHCLYVFPAKNTKACRLHEETTGCSPSRYHSCWP